VGIGILQEGSVRAMNELVARFTGFFSTVTLQAKPLAEPEPVYGQPRALTGFYATLTPEQKARALAYTGDENHGDQTFARKSY
jgi:hypothetical protein